MLIIIHYTNKTKIVIAPTKCYIMLYNYIIIKQSIIEYQHTQTHKHTQTHIHRQTHSNQLSIFHV